ncbi:PAAR domain-containing protein [Trinickia fusca]|uniref:PAAR domain-containing protein n=1 Tax=Trinickia fusca TaxID=2419777 RepID=A0A494X7Y7_9BURK|nr:PAAR domain-containing protein [Trinickia fusca]RKP46845.1 PAAR domain-containing protein [Trinickia fusca]
MKYSKHFWLENYQDARKMQRCYLRKGDKSSGNGVVQEGIDGMTCDGAELTFLGAKVDCPACNSTGAIVAKGPRWPDDNFMGKRPALDGDICVCGCSPQPVMHASQTRMFESYTSGELAAMGFADGGRPVARAEASAVPVAQPADTPAALPASTFEGVQPFAYTGALGNGPVGELAARGVSEHGEAECNDQYEREMDECMAYRSAMGGQRFMDACSQRAFENYQRCRGY